LAIYFKKVMLMPEAFKSAANHFINKKMWRIKLGYFGGKILPDKEMPGPPGNSLAQFYQSAGSAGNGLFAGMFGGYEMKINTPRQIKTPFNGSVDVGVKFDAGHIQLFVIARYEAIANFSQCDCFVPRNDKLI
jgi:hypothetical protein